MSEHKPYVSPNGSIIVGTKEIVSGTSLILGINDDGTPVYRGQTILHYDDQETVEKEGKIVFVDTDGDEWTFDQLKRLS
jgi:hypothetical protein